MSLGKRKRDGTLVLRVKKESPDAIIPYKATEGSAGYDLTSVEDAEIAPSGKALISIGLSFEIPIGYYGRIGEQIFIHNLLYSITNSHYQLHKAPRSSLAFKNHIDVGAGVIDSDYRGIVKVLLFNLDNERTFSVKSGDRIAQIIIEAIANDLILEECSELPSSKRNTGGFGSTGIGFIGEQLKLSPDENLGNNDIVTDNTTTTTATSGITGDDNENTPKYVA